MELKPVQKTVREDITSPQLHTAEVDIAFAGPKNSDIKEALTVEALIVLLTGYKGAKLTKALKPLNTKPVAQILAIAPKLSDPHLIYMEASFKPGEEEQGLEVIKNCLKDTAENPPSEKEMEIVKNKLTDTLSRISESSAKITDLVGEFQTLNGGLSYYEDSLKIINNLTPQDIQNAARKYLDINKASIVVGHPESAKNADKSNIVSFTGRIKNNSLGNITEHDLSNNVHLVLNDNPNVIRTSANISFSIDNFPETIPGTVHIIEKMMEKGTEKHSEDEMNEIIDVNCLNIAPIGRSNFIGMKFDCMDKKFLLGLDVAKEFLLNPSFTQEKLDEAREEIKLDMLSEPKSARDRH